MAEEKEKEKENEKEKEDSNTHEPHDSNITHEPLKIHKLYHGGPILPPNVKLPEKLQNLPRNYKERKKYLEDNKLRKDYNRIIKKIRKFRSKHPVKLSPQMMKHIEKKCKEKKNYCNYLIGIYGDLERKHLGMYDGTGKSRGNDDDSPNETMFIGIVVACSVVALILLICLFSYCCRCSGKGKGKNSGEKSKKSTISSKGKSMKASNTSKRSSGKKSKSVKN
ncbi:hypothetical protein RDWZM_004910 [Blomia tropicalis]|uniref:Uncharacterized protein n=1 Tax=Blomia tropicalis TaxID=40697 RepID=A0A9Q0RKE8_BLOTA|nr:hypothetical protein BLOT_014285 [Blomia tropicalis]KAJ6219098.1 hypothetical protein RDWZM_004910 [Blomia tropicalis]